jgi:hypothetical protein
MRFPAAKLNSRSVLGKPPYDVRFRSRQGNELHKLVIGHDSHFGRRATQIVAPRSINA